MRDPPVAIFGPEVGGIGRQIALAKDLIEIAKRHRAVEIGNEQTGTWGRGASDNGRSPHQVPGGGRRGVTERSIGQASGGLSRRGLRARLPGGSDAACAAAAAMGGPKAVWTAR